MGKNQENKEDFLKAKETEDQKPEPVGPQDWVCITECFCSDNGNSLRSRRWLPGDSVFMDGKPSKHFVTREEYNHGAGGRDEYLQKFAQFGGQVTDATRNLPLHVLKAWVVEQERAYLRRQAQSS